MGKSLQPQEKIVEGSSSVEGNKNGRLTFLSLLKHFV